MSLRVASRPCSPAFIPKCTAKQSLVGPEAGVKSPDLEGGHGVNSRFPAGNQSCRPASPPLHDARPKDEGRHRGKGVHLPWRMDIGLVAVLDAYAAAVADVDEAAGTDRRLPDDAGIGLFRH